jgi:hypothetical protein
LGCQYGVCGRGRYEQGVGQSWHAAREQQMLVIRFMSGGGVQRVHRAAVLLP